MTPTELRDIMLESRLPKEAWPCAFEDGDWMLEENDGIGLNWFRISAQCAAALCEVALRRAIRAAVVGARPVILATSQGDTNWRAWITTTALDGGRVLHGDVYDDSELHALARLHAAVVERSRP